MTNRVDALPALTIIVVEASFAFFVQHLFAVTLDAVVVTICGAIIVGLAKSTFVRLAIALVAIAHVIIWKDAVVANRLKVGAFKLSEAAVACFGVAVVRARQLLAKRVLCIISNFRNALVAHILNITELGALHTLALGAVLARNTVWPLWHALPISIRIISNIHAELVGATADRLWTIRGLVNSTLTGL